MLTNTYMVILSLTDKFILNFILMLNLSTNRFFNPNQNLSIFNSYTYQYLVNAYMVKGNI